MYKPKKSFKTNILTLLICKNEVFKHHCTDIKLKSVISTNINSNYENINCKDSNYKNINYEELEKGLNTFISLHYETRGLYDTIKNNFYSNKKQIIDKLQIYNYTYLKIGNTGWMKDYKENTYVVLLLN